MTYRLTPRAIKDIDGIAGYVSERNPAAAVDLISGFLHRFETLAITLILAPRETTFSLVFATSS